MRLNIFGRGPNVVITSNGVRYRDELKRRPFGLDRHRNCTYVHKAGESSQSEVVEQTPSQSSSKERL